MGWKDRIRKVMRKKLFFFFLHLLFPIFEPKWHSVFCQKRVRWQDDWLLNGSCTHFRNIIHLN